MVRVLTNTANAPLLILFFAGSYSDGDPAIYHESMGSQASQHGFGTPLNRARRKTFRSSFDPDVRLKAWPDFKGRVCPGGHMCRLTVYLKSNRSCNICDVEIVAGAVGQRCFMCEFDLCPGCSTGPVDVQSTPVAAHDSAAASAPVDSSVTLQPSLPARDDVSPPSLLPKKVYSIFLPPPTSVFASRPVQDATLETARLVANTSTTAVVVNPHPVRVPTRAPGPRLNRLKLTKPTSRTCNPPSLPNGAVLLPFGKTNSSPSKAVAANLPPPASVAVPPSSPPMSAAVTAVSTKSPTGAASSPAASPDSPVSRSEAFHKLCRLNPDKRFGISLGIQCANTVVSIGIQCSSPDPLFVDLRVPRPQLDGGNCYGVPIGRPTPRHPPFGHRNVPELFDDPIFYDGKKGSAGDLGSARHKVATVYVQNAQVIRMPRDGHCLYHALIHGTGNGIGSGIDAMSILQLRKELVGFVRMNSKLEVHGHSLERWIGWECLCRYINIYMCVYLCIERLTRLCSVEDYAKKMLTEDLAWGGYLAWGGCIELLCFSHCRRMNVHVYRVIIRALSVR